MVNRLAQLVLLLTFGFFAMVSRGADVAANIGTPEEVAGALGVTEAALAQMRFRKTGPPYTKVGYRVRYLWSDVEKYLADQRRDTTDTPADK
jgi:hypothetical protein